MRSEDSTEEELKTRFKHCLPSAEKQKNKAYTCLQEIKAVAEKTIDIYYPDYYDEGFEEDIVTEFAKDILDLIAKFESEG